MRNCIYRLIGDNRQILYIGKAGNLKQRLSNHIHLPEGCYEKTKKIEYHSFLTKADMDFAEKYYIAKYNPFYNDLLKEDITIKVKELDDAKFTLYETKQKESKRKSNNTMRDVELYIKHNSFDNYTLKDGFIRYRVPKEIVFSIEDKFENVYIFFDGVDGFVLNGEKYEKCYYGVYSYEDLHKFYVYYEDKPPF